MHQRTRVQLRQPVACALRPVRDSGADASPIV